MNEADEREEYEHLQRVKAKLDESVKRLEGRVKHYAAQAREHVAHMWKGRRDMDHSEKAVARETTQQIVATGDTVAAAR